MDQLNLGAWVGRSVEDRGAVSEVMAAQLQATVGCADTQAPGMGDLLPGLWHWCAFPPLTHVNDLGSDGHPGPGTLLPPIRLNRRMWAGGGLRFHAPLRVGDALERRSTVRSLVEKEGATGPLILVTVDHMLFGPRGLVVEERQDIVFLDIPDTFTPPKKRAMPTPTQARHPTSEPLLFRYSALTFNAHRIHYDLDYTQQIEKYPGLVVHGPLQAMMLMRHAVETRGGMPSQFDFRGVHPMFLGSDLEISTTEEDGALALFAGQDGHQTMTATAIWEDTQ